MESTSDRGGRMVCANEYDEEEEEPRVIDHVAGFLAKHPSATSLLGALVLIFAVLILLNFAGNHPLAPFR